MRIEQSDTVQASAACGQFPLLTDYIVCHKKNLSSLQPFPGGDFLRFFLITRIQDTDSLASVTEYCNSLKSFLISVQIKSFRFLHRKSIRHVYSGTDGSVNMRLPYGLHIDPLPVIQRHSSHKVVRKFRIALQPVLFHITLNNLCIYFIVDIRAVQGFCLPLVIIRVDRLDSA